MQKTGLTKTKGKRIKPGRPKAEIDWSYVGEMLAAGATAVNIAETLGCVEDTLRKRCPIDNNCSFSEFSRQKRARGEVMLRVKQFEVAINGNIPMLIWLGKQRLGQAEKAQTTPEWLARLLEQLGVHVAQAIIGMKFETDIENRLLSDIEDRWKSIQT